VSRQVVDNQLTITAASWGQSKNWRLIPWKDRLQAQENKDTNGRIRFFAPTLSIFADLIRLLSEWP
jgi:hypothetical protein